MATATSFEHLPGAVDMSAALAPPTVDTVAFDDEKLTDAAALGMVIRDAQIAQAFLASKGRPRAWDEAEGLYAASVPVKKWPNGKKRAHLSMPAVLEGVETLQPQIHLGFFSDKQPFLLEARGKTTTAGARATAKVLNWAVRCSGFKEEIRKMLKSALLYGTCIGKWGYRVTTKEKKEYKQGQDGVEAHISEYEGWEPTFEYCDLRSVLVDPALRCQDIRGAKFVIFQKFIVADDLDELRDSYDNVPTRDELKNILTAKGEPAVDSLSGSKIQTDRELQAERQNVESSSDPLKQPLELLEYHSDGRIITVLQRRIVIGMTDDDGSGFVSCSFIDILNAFYGFGVAKLLEGEQKLQAGTINAWIDSLSLVLNPAFHRKKGLTPRNQTIETGPGTVVNDDGELVPLSVQSVTDQALLAVQNSEARARRRIGANFGQDMPNQAMRTAEGVQEFTAGIQIKLQYFIENFAEMVFVPVLEQFICMAKDNLTPEDINGILSDEDGKNYEGDILEVYNGTCSINVLSSTKLAARRAMASMIPLLMQLFSAAPVQDSLMVQGKKVDYNELLNQLLDLAGWDAPGLIVDATPQDQQRAMMNNPAAVKALSDQHKLAAQHQNDMELESAKIDGRTANTVIKHGLATDAKANEPAKPLPTR